jgi:hypothetical protein
VLYSEDDCSYFGLVLIPYDEICWIPFSEVKGKQSICTNIEHDLLVEYRGNIDGLKKCQQQIMFSRKPKKQAKMRVFGITQN